MPPFQAAPESASPIEPPRSRCLGPMPQCAAALTQSETAQRFCAQLLIKVRWVLLVVCSSRVFFDVREIITISNPWQEKDLLFFAFRDFFTNYELLL